MKVTHRAFQRNEPFLQAREAKFWSEMKNHGIAHFKIAKHDEKCIGVGAAFFYSTMAWIGYMGVDPLFQKKGVGIGILSNLMNYIKEREIQTIKLNASGLGKRLYSKMGFKEEYEVSLYKILDEIQKSPFTFNLKLSKSIPKWVLDMDKQSFGGDRSSLLKLLLHYGKLIISENNGYGFVTYNRVGPIIAESEDTAIEIVKYAYELGARTICIPNHQKLSKNFLSPLKCTISDTRMILGKEIDENLNLIYAGYSFATG